MSCLCKLRVQAATQLTLEALLQENCQLANLCMYVHVHAVHALFFAVWTVTAPINGDVMRETKSEHCWWY